MSSEGFNSKYTVHVHVCGHFIPEKVTTYNIIAMYTVFTMLYSNTEVKKRTMYRFVLNQQTDLDRHSALYMYG